MSSTSQIKKYETIRISVHLLGIGLRAKQNLDEERKINNCPIISVHCTSLLFFLYECVVKDLTNFLSGVEVLKLFS